MVKCASSARENGEALSHAELGMQLGSNKKNPFGFFSFLENCDVNSAGLVAASIIFNLEGNLLAFFQ